MRISQRVSEHLARTIERTPLASAPFDHLIFDRPFPRDLYADAVARLPADAFYRELKHSDARLPDGRSARLQFPLLAANVARLPQPLREFWNEFVAGLMAPAVETAYKAKFRAALEGVAGRPVASIKLRPYATLFRDLGGYKISIHPDSPHKAITTHFYLPADERQLHLGTLFHAKNGDGSYREAVAMRFAPNSGYAFVVTPASYHSVRPMRPDDRPRNSLMVIVNFDRGPLIEGFKAARARVRGLYDRIVGPRGARPEAGEGRYERDCQPAGAVQAASTTRSRPRYFALYKA